MGLTVDQNLVKRVAELARLRLNEEEVAYYKNQLAKILDYVEQLDECPLDADESDPQLSMETCERADLVRESLSGDLAVREAKVTSGTSFKVPRVVE